MTLALACSSAAWSSESRTGSASRSNCRSLAGRGNHPHPRSRIEHLRAQQQTTAAPARPAPDPGAASQASSVIRTLTAELTDSKAHHRAEVEQLRQALAAAHGENLLLRRRLGHPDQAAAADAAGISAAP